MFPLLGVLRRKEWVTAQFMAGQQAREYADEHSLSSPDSLYRTARIRLLHELLASFPKGELLDAGCGPGVLAQSLCDSPAFNYRITLVDQSVAMISYCVTRADESDSGKIRALVGDLENLPFADASFDVTITTGALEYTDARTAVRQLSRVTRSDGAVVVSMLNPLSPYRLADWVLYRPALRLVASTMRALRIPGKRSRPVNHSGIRALPPGVLSRYLRESGLVPIDVIYFDLTPLIPPLDRIPALRHWSTRQGRHLMTTRGWRRWMATGYVIVAKHSVPAPVRHIA